MKMIKMRINGLSAMKILSSVMAVLLLGVATNAIATIEIRPKKSGGLPNLQPKIMHTSASLIGELQRIRRSPSRSADGHHHEIYSLLAANEPLLKKQKADEELIRQVTESLIFAQKTDPYADGAEMWADFKKINPTAYGKALDSLSRAPAYQQFVELLKSANSTEDVDQGNG